MDRGAWYTTIHGVPKESDMTEQITTTTKEARSIEEDNGSITERGTGYIVRLGILHFEAPKEYPGGDVKKAVLQMLLELKKAF